MISLFAKKNEYNIDSHMSHILFHALYTGYEQILEMDVDTHRYFNILPSDSVLSSLYPGTYNCFSDCRLKELISHITSLLLCYGKAYIVFLPYYNNIVADDGTKTQILSSISVNYLSDNDAKRIKYDKGYDYKDIDGKPIDLFNNKRNYIVLNIQDLGFSKRYFPRILKLAKKYDIFNSSNYMTINSVEGYEYFYHSRKYQILQAKATKNIGWVLNVGKYSDSYLIYKKIQSDMLKIRFVEYIIRKLNDGLKGLTGLESGEIVVRFKEKKYETLWNDYENGRITVSELNHAMFNT